MYGVSVVRLSRRAGRGPAQLLAMLIIVCQGCPALLAAVASPASPGNIRDVRPSRSPAVGPGLAVSLEPDALTVNISNSQSGPALFNGSVRMDRIVPGLRYTITLSGSCDWPSIVSPTTFVVKDDTAMDFTATVVVPPATPRDTTETMIVSATAKAPGTPTYTAQDQATVTVAPYYGVHLAVPVDTVELRRGSTTHILCNLSNRCNGPMGFQIQLVDPPDGITLEPVRIVTLAQGDILDVDLAFQVTGDASTGTHELVIQIGFSGDAPGAPPKTESMTIDVVPATGRTGTSLVVVAAVAVAIAVVVLYLRRSSRRHRALAIPSG